MSRYQRWNELLDLLPGDGQLAGAQRLAAALAGLKGIDPDQPRALSRSVILA